ncbi:hypothetical protein [Rhodococcus erythropolis]|uniref:hypothetical protein n=1 Tax=Rhodococcus erythropolis TaxID=1833 RepID=UPI000878BE12|nr:hypothetical protein [Rhodococcus erythropolis]OFV76953.1 hypothetical protein RERY_24040 [Rhodococcus erythropolis]
MRRVPIVVTAVWLALSTWLVIWMLEKLLRADQQGRVLPLRDGADLVAPLLIGVAWGFYARAVGVLVRARRRGEALDVLQMVPAKGRVVEVHDSGITHEHIEGHPLRIRHVVVRVDPPGEEPFLGALVSDDDKVRIGDLLPLRYQPEDPDTVYADEGASTR